MATGKAIDLARLEAAISSELSLGTASFAERKLVREGKLEECLDSRKASMIRMWNLNMIFFGVVTLILMVTAAIDGKTEFLAIPTWVSLLTLFFVQRNLGRMESMQLLLRVLRTAMEPEPVPADEVTR